MKLRHLYLVFCLFGLLLPYSQFVPWIIEHRALNLSMFMRDLFANRIAAFFALDVIVSAIVLLSFIQSEGTAIADAIPLVANAVYSVRRSFARPAAFSLFAATRAGLESHLNFRQ